MRFGIKRKEKEVGKVHSEGDEEKEVGKIHSNLLGLRRIAQDLPRRKNSKGPTEEKKWEKSKK